jgi:hypothetical protein
MKLYTEEQVKKMLDLARFTYNSEDKILLSQTPIELPSDEEIEKRFNRGNETNDPLISTFIGGQIFSAKWIRDKIQGGNL